MIDTITPRKLLLLCITTAMIGQVPISDTLVVTFPSEVHVGSQSLPAGEYTIRQLNTSSSPRLLEFSTNKGTAIQASATAIAVVDINNQNESSVILETRGGMQYIHRIWVKGKSYGYEFPVADAVGSELSSNSRTLRLNGTYAAGAMPAKPTETAAVNAPEANAREAAVPAQTQPAEAPAAPVTPPDVANAEQPKPNPERAVDRQADPQSGQPNPSPATAPEQTPATPASTPAMPETSLDWMVLVLVGMGLLTTGFILRAGRPRA